MLCEVNKRFAAIRSLSGSLFRCSLFVLIEINHGNWWRLFLGTFVLRKMNSIEISKGIPFAEQFVEEKIL